MRGSNASAGGRPGMQIGCSARRADWTGPTALRAERKQDSFLPLLLSELLSELLSLPAMLLVLFALTYCVAGAVDVSCLLVKRVDLWNGSLKWGTVLNIAGVSDLVDRGTNAEKA